MLKTEAIDPFKTKGLEVGKETLNTVQVKIPFENSGYNIYSSDFFPEKIFLGLIEIEISAKCRRSNRRIGLDVIDAQSLGFSN